MNIKINKNLVLDGVVVPENCELYANMSDSVFTNDSFIFGTISDCMKISKNKNIENNKNYNFYSDLNIRSWIPFLKEEYINNNGYFKQSWQLNENDIGRFCRMDSAIKTFKGYVIKNIADINQIKNSTYEEDLLYLCSIKNIDNVNRYWVCNGEIVEYTNSNIHNEINDEMLKYANKIINQYFEPAIKYTIDICKDKDNNSFKVLDYNNFSCSEFYNCNINKIIDKI